AQTADDGSGSDPARVVDEQAVKAVDGDAAVELLRDLPDHGDALFRREQPGLLVLVVGDRDDHVIENGQGSLDDVEVAVRDRVERSRVYRTRVAHHPSSSTPTRS